MSDVNKVILVGHLGADPVERQTKKGVPVVNFSVATSRVSESTSEGRKRETQWHRIVSWGKQGETCARYLRKGHPVYVEGMLRVQRYTDSKGESRTAVEIHASNVRFLSRGQSASTGLAD